MHQKTRILFSLFLLIFFVDLRSLLEIIFYFSISQILKFNLIISSLYLIFLFIDLYIFILFLKGKIKIPEYLPLFIFNWLREKEVISKLKPIEIRVFKDMFIKTIIMLRSIV